jgi:hypothetical protein
VSTNLVQDGCSKRNQADARRIVLVRFALAKRQQDEVTLQVLAALP